MKKHLQNIKWVLTFILMVMLFMLTNSCKKEINSTSSKGQLPILTTNTTVSDITLISATCGGDITSEGGSAVIARGVCWNTSTNPTIANNKTIDGAGSGYFTSNLTCLASGTLYYVRAYATNSFGTAYGLATSFTTQNNITETVTDIDGNLYHTVIIGTQVWLLENLKVTHYRNGDAIPNVTDGTTWSNLTTGAYCDYNITSSNSSIYGRLYNFYAVVDSRNLCPTGWHVPSDAEWTTLTDYLGGESVVGGILKEIGTIHWASPNTGATNESGFTALPGGFCNLSGTFGEINDYGWWWSSTQYDPTTAWWRRMYYNYIGVYRDHSGKTNGFSVRCLSDNKKQ